MNLFELEYSGTQFDYEIINIERVNNCVKFLSNQHHMKRLRFFMDNVAFWDPIMKMTNLEFLDLEIDYEYSTEQEINILQNRTNNSVKFLKITQQYNDSDLKLCHAIVNYFSGVINLDLM